MTNRPPPPVTVVVMGVSGAGKSTVAAGVADALEWDFAEGDRFHPAANVANMHAGVPLDDDDRWPWLEAVAGWIGEREVEHVPAVVACSALRRAYRDVLRRGHPSVWVVHVDASRATLQRRLAHRTGHYMPASLLDSQLDTLETLEPDEPGVTVSGEGPTDDVVADVVARIVANGWAPSGSNRDHAD